MREISSDSAPAKRRGRPPKARPVEREAECAHPSQSEASLEGCGVSKGSGAEQDDQYQGLSGNSPVPIDLGNGCLGNPSDVESLEKHRNTLAAHERHGLIEEALYTHEMQLEYIRFDSKNRRWLFRPEARNSRANLLIQLKRGPDEREALIDNAKFGAENVREDVEAAIDLLDEALS